MLTAKLKFGLQMEEAMGGSVILDKKGRFYLKLAGTGNIEMSLLAEGYVIEEVTGRYGTVTVFAKKK